MGCEGIRGRTGARAWEVIHIYTGSFTPCPGPHPLLPPPDLDKEGRVDNQRDTPPNTRLTVQPIRATSAQLIQSLSLRDYPMVSGINLFFATFILFNNLLIDLLYAYLDPRIRYQ